MGNGTRPGPLNGPTSIAVDDGTTARVGTPSPGPVGLDTKNDEAKTPPPPSIADRILAHARGKLTTVHGDGECFTLADDSLKDAGAKSAADFGRVAPDVDYVWGKAVTRVDLKPGDVIQMKGYRVDIEETTKSDKSTEIVDIFEERPHHTAIVESIGTDGRVTVLEQNHPIGTAVTRNVIHLTNATYSSGNTTTKVKVKGTLWYYRPQPKAP